MSHIICARLILKLLPVLHIFTTSQCCITTLLARPLQQRPPFEEEGQFVWWMRSQPSPQRRTFYFFSRLDLCQVFTIWKLSGSRLLKIDSPQPIEWWLVSNSFHSSPPAFAPHALTKAYLMSREEWSFWIVPISGAALCLVAGAGVYAGREHIATRLSMIHPMIQHDIYIDI